MKTHDALTILQTEINKFVAAKQPIDAVALAAFLERLRAMHRDDQQPIQNVPAEIRLEQYKAELSNFFDRERRGHEWEMEEFRTVIQAGQAAVRTCVLVNGGAAVALLAFLGNAAASDQLSKLTSEIAAAMAIYAIGVGAGAVTSGFTYLSQWFFAKQHLKVGLSLNITAIVAGLSSLAAFCVGCYRAYVAFA